MRACFAAVSLVICTGALACRVSTEVLPILGPVPDGSLMTDATGYVARPIAGSARPVQYEFTVISRFQNRSDAPVYLGRCYSNSTQPMYGIEPADGGAVVPAYAPIWGCVGVNNQFEILPGAVRVDTFLVRGPNAFDETKQQAIGETDGVFRLFLVVASAPGDGAPAPPGSLGVSNAFVVRTSK